MKSPQVEAYGLTATFPTAEALTAAVSDLRERGYRRMDAFSPFPIDGLAELLGMRPTRLPWAFLAGGVLGAAGIYLLILYSVLIDYPVDVGGRPLNSWPPFLVLAFEAGILGAALAGFVGLLFANGQPEYYHPVFNASDFSYGRGGTFHLLVESADPLFRPRQTRTLLEDLGATHVEAIAP
jgi:hypothetical protein